ncbi:VanZ family protein [Pseudodesulfovibrio sp. zrk46]|nr:VanZ family protein [Pseudodesulfovibrio sp. zrk46]
MAYGWLAFIHMLAFPGSSFRTTALLLIAWGGALEILQEFVPYRHSSIEDILANSIGIMLGGYVSLHKRKHT